MFNKAFLPATLWLIISTILLSLPGNDLPEAGFFSIPYFDKIIHFVMFLLLSGLFCYPLHFIKKDKSTLKKQYLLITIFCVAYGVLMEFVQKNFVPGRSFDLLDIIFDGVGALAGILLVIKIQTKKIGPDGNRGRNQN